MFADAVPGFIVFGFFGAWLISIPVVGRLAYKITKSRRDDYVMTPWSKFCRGFFVYMATSFVLAIVFIFASGLSISALKLNTGHVRQTETTSLNDSTVAPTSKTPAFPGAPVETPVNIPDNTGRIPAVSAGTPQPQQPPLDAPVPLSAAPQSPSTPETSIPAIASTAVPPSETSFQAAAHPSFDCGKASTVPEKLICSNFELADADSRMVSAYKRALSMAADKEAIKSAQADWRKGMRDRCSDIACLMDAYEIRLGELTR